MTMSRVCSGMLSTENGELKFLKNCEKHKMHVHHMHHSSRARVTFVSLQTSLSLTRNVNVTIAKELCYIFSEISILVTFH